MCILLKILQITIFLLLFHFQFGNSIWWYLSQFDESVGKSQLLCSAIPNLHPTQRRLCKTRPDVVWKIGEATREAILECQFHFRFYKWNCSTMARDSSVFGKVFIKGGTPELAFVQAMTTASAVLSVSKACSAGSVNCGCALKIMEEDSYNSNDFKWNGCTESTKFALNFVRRFVDAGENEQRDPKAKMTMYNNKAGREGLLRHSVTWCKCHGLSGSCTMRTCWRFLPTLRTVGLSLKEKYDGAIKVEFDPKGHIMTVDNLQKKPTRTNLIYFEDSPDGCVVDNSRGRLGTSGRICKSVSKGIDSCDILCCENGHETTRVSVTYSCDCHFHWCCEVKCKKCQEWQAISRCKKKVEEDDMEVDPPSPNDSHPVAITNKVNRFPNENTDYKRKSRNRGYWGHSSTTEFGDSPPSSRSNAFLSSRGRSSDQKTQSAVVRYIFYESVVAPSLGKNGKRQEVMRKYPHV